MMVSLLLALGCSEVRLPDPSTPVVATEPAPPDPPTPAVDCDAVPPIEPGLVLEPGPDPVHVFQPRASGEWLWGHDGAILTGPDVDEAVVEVVTEGRQETIRETSLGIFWVGLESPPVVNTLFHVAPGGQPVAFADGDLWTQFDVHPTGAVLYTLQEFLVFVDPSGVVEQFPLTVQIQDVAYGLDYDELWVATVAGLERWAVDAAGRPDRTVPPDPIHDAAYFEIEVGECGLVYGIRPDSPFGVFGDQVLERVWPTGQVETAEGRREFMGNLRFGRGPDEQTYLFVLGGGYNSNPIYMRWDVGVRERPE